MKKQKILLAALLSASYLGAAMLTGCAENTGGANDTTTTTPGETTTGTAGEASISFSWWGGESRHEATQAAISAFEDENPGIKVSAQFGAWTGWEENMATKFFANTAPDVNQINWNWITSFSSDGSKFLDLNTVADVIDLAQFDTDALEQCTLAGKLQGVPVSLTGRIFHWNKTTFEEAGLEPPMTLGELYAAADAFKEKLGGGYYPLVLGEYDRAILLVYYLETIYGKPWVEDNKLQYTKAEIMEGLEFLGDLEDKGVIPTIPMLAGDGADSLDKNPKWIDGRYAGIFEWDSAAAKFNGALADEQVFVVGDYLSGMGDYKGGFAKVALALAISENTPHPRESAMLIEYLLNSEAGAKLLGSERGIPLSAKALRVTTAEGMLDPLTAEANRKVLDWVSFPLDPKFEDAKLKNNPEGVYYDVFSGLSYKEYSVEEAAEILIEGINSVL